MRHMTTRSFAEISRATGITTDELRVWFKRCEFLGAFMVNVRDPGNRQVRPEIANTILEAWREAVKQGASHRDAHRRAAQAHRDLESARIDGHPVREHAAS